MNKISNNMILLAVVVGMVSIWSYAFGAGKRGSTEAYLERLHNQGKERVIIRFKDKIDTDVVRQYNGKLIRKFKIINAVVCEVDQSAIESLKQRGNVKYVVPDMVVRIPETREVPADQTAGGGGRIDGSVSSAYDGSVTVRWNNLEAGLNSKAAWDNYGLDGTGIKIAILDTGINYTMENLDDNYLGGYDFVDDDDDPLTTDVNVSHGTKVASLAVGEGVNKVVGVAYNASYYAVRVLDDDGVSFVGDIIAGIEWASTEPHKADIISMSLGTYGGGPSWEIVWKPAWREACNNAYNADIVLIAGSGNDGYDYSLYPAAFENVISVGAHNVGQTLFDYMGDATNGGVDVVTPGADVRTVKPDNSEWRVWGTSFAVPHASALIALQLQYARQNNITVNNGYLMEVMKHSAHHLTGETYDPVYQGKGKAWAAESLGATDPNDGAIDLMADNWPLDMYATFTDARYELDGYPAYYPGTDMVQDVNVVNVTDVLGSYSDDVVNLMVTTRQRYYQREGGNFMPGDANEVFPSTSINSGQEIRLSDSYYILAETVPGLNQTTVEFVFQFSGNTRQMHIAYNGLDNARWLFVEELTADFEPDGDVDLSDFSVLSGEWAQTGTLTSDIAPEPVDGVVDILDLLEFTSHWLAQTTY